MTAAVAPPQSSALQQPRLLADDAAVPAAQPPAAPVDLETRAVGCLLGAVCGNALGAPVQHDKHWQIARMFPYGLTEFWAHDLSRQPVERGQVTGEALWMLSVARSLVAARTCDARAVAQQLAERCNPDGALGTMQDDGGDEEQEQGLAQLQEEQREATAANHPRRYSPHAHLLLRRLRRPGAALLDLRFLAQLPAQTAQFWASGNGRTASSFADRWEREPWGPADYGAATGVAAPVAVAYAGAPWPVLDQAVQEACLLSHSHPAGVDGARVAAAALQCLLRDGARASPLELLAHLEGVAATEDMRSKLALIRRELFQVDEIASYPAFYKGPQWHRLTRVLSQLTYHDHATVGTEAVAVALWAVLSNWARPRQAICLAAGFGGSAPATALLAGALAGALHGRAWVPASWWEALENVPGVVDADEGVRDEAAALARQLAQLRCTQVGMPAPAQQ